jgi:hypothetical protein
VGVNLVAWNSAPHRDHGSLWRHRQPAGPLVKRTARKDQVAHMASRPPRREAHRLQPANTPQRSRKVAKKNRRKQHRRQGHNKLNQSFDSGSGEKLPSRFF